MRDMALFSLWLLYLAFVGGEMKRDFFYSFLIIVIVNITFTLVFSWIDKAFAYCSQCTLQVPQYPNWTVHAWDDDWVPTGEEDICNTKSFNAFGNNTQYGGAPSECGYQSINGNYVYISTILTDCNGHVVISAGRPMYNVVCSMTTNPNDPDGDGLENDIDPWPDDDGNFYYRQLFKTVDENGNVTGTMYEFKNEDGEIVNKFIGDYDSETDSLVIQNGVWLTEQQFAENFGTAEFSTGPDNPVDGGVSANNLLSEEETPTLETGSDSTGNSTDTEHLQDVVDNTNKIVANQATLAEILTGISNKVGAGNEINSTYISNLGSDPDGESGGGLEKADLDESIQDMLGDSSGTTIEEPETPELDPSELTDAYDDVHQEIVDSQLGHYYDDIGFDISTNSVLSIPNIFDASKTETIDFSQWQNFFNLVGNLLLASVSITVSLWVLGFDVF
jgi:hypothetical protein